LVGAHAEIIRCPPPARKRAPRGIRASGPAAKPSLEYQIDKIEDVGREIVGANSSKRVMSRLAQYLLASLALGLLVSASVVAARRAEPASAPALTASAWVANAVPPPSLPLTESLIDVVPDRRVGLQGILPAQEEGPIERGTVWAAPSGRGFGRHVARSLHLLADPAWILVRADSGIWFLEAKSLARRARLRTGAISAVDVSTDGRRIAYAEYTPRPAEDPLTEVEEPAELVVVEFPSLFEVHRSRVVKPTQVRFSPDARAVASAAKNGATVVPLDGRGAPWTTKREPNQASDAIAVVPLDDARVAYLTRLASLIIQDRSGAERLVHQYTTKSTDFIFFELTHAWSDGLLYYDAKLDRVLSVQDTKAVVVDAASTESPRLGNPIDVAAGPVDAMRPYAFTSLNELAKRFALGPDTPYSSDHSLVAFGAHGDAYFPWYGNVVRLERGVALRSPDFDTPEDRWEPSLGEHDIVFTTYGAKEMVVRRVSLDTPALDITPERLGAFADHTQHSPFIFDNGDRVFPVGDAAARGGIVRLPRGGRLQAVEWLGVKQMGSAKPIRGEGRVAFVNGDDDVVEVDPEGVRVLGRIGLGDRVSWHVEKKCWEVASFRKTHFLCAPR
jgi:hypothetical protein